MPVGTQNPLRVSLTRRSLTISRAMVAAGIDGRSFRTRASTLGAPPSSFKGFGWPLALTKSLSRYHRWKAMPIADTTDESRSMRREESSAFFLNFPSAKDDSFEMLSFESPDRCRKSKTARISRSWKVLFLPNPFPCGFRVLVRTFSDLWQETRY